MLLALFVIVFRAGLRRDVVNRLNLFNARVVLNKVFSLVRTPERSENSRHGLDSNNDY